MHNDNNIVRVTKRETFRWLTTCKQRPIPTMRNPIECFFRVFEVPFFRPMFDIMSVSVIELISFLLLLFVFFFFFLIKSYSYFSILLQNMFLFLREKYV